jgi:hypothetical protein
MREGSYHTCAEVRLARELGPEADVGSESRAVLLRIRRRKLADARRASRGRGPGREREKTDRHYETNNTSTHDVPPSRE